MGSIQMRFSRLNENVMPFKYTQCALGIVEMRHLVCRHELIHRSESEAVYASHPAVEEEKREELRFKVLPSFVCGNVISE